MQNTKKLENRIKKKRGTITAVKYPQNFTITPERDKIGGSFQPEFTLWTIFFVCIR